MNSYYENMIQRVIDCSVSDNWENARLEWSVERVEEDENLDTKCVCGHDGLRYLYTIRNRLNGNKIYPIGSECVKKFCSDKMSETVDALEDIMRASSVELAYNPSRLTMRMIVFLSDKGVLNDWECSFMLSVKRKRALTVKQNLCFNKIIKRIENWISDFLNHTTDEDKKQ